MSPFNKSFVRNIPRNSFFLAIILYLLFCLIFLDFTLYGLLTAVGFGLVAGAAYDRVVSPKQKIKYINALYFILLYIGLFSDVIGTDPGTWGITHVIITMPAILISSIIPILKDFHMSVFPSLPYFLSFYFYGVLNSILLFFLYAGVIKVLDKIKPLYQIIFAIVIIFILFLVLITR